MVPTGPILELMDVLAGSISLRYAVFLYRVRMLRVDVTLINSVCVPEYVCIGVYIVCRAARPRRSRSTAWTL